MTLLKICDNDKDNNISNTFNTVNVVNAINRDDDIVSRGELCKVHDYDGKMVYLKDAKIWCNNDGNYMEPRIYEPHFFDTLVDICKRIFCSHVE